MKELFRERNLVVILVCLLGFVVAASASAEENRIAGRRTYQIAEGFYLADSADARVGGSLTRSLNKLEVRISGALKKKRAYSYWVVLWNNPNRCSGDCGADDFGVKGAAIFYGAGCVTDGAGTCNVSFDIEAGGLPMGKEFFGGFKEGKGHKCEVHVIGRYHAAPVAGMVGAQTGTFETSCTDPAVCMDEIAVVFKPI